LVAGRSRLEAVRALRRDSRAPGEGRCHADAALLRPKFHATSRAPVECQVLGLVESRLAHTALRTVRSAFNWDLGPSGSTTTT